MKSVLFTLAVLIIASTCNARGLKVPTKVANRIGTCATIGVGIAMKFQEKRWKEQQARNTLKMWRLSLSSKAGRAATSTDIIEQINHTPFVFKFPIVDKNLLQSLHSPRLRPTSSYLNEAKPSIKSILTNPTDTTYESPACESSTHCIPQASEMDKTMMRMIDFHFTEMDKELIETVQKEDIESIHTVVPMTLKQKE